MLKELKQVSHSIIHENPYWQYGFDVYVKPDGGSEGEYHYVHSRGSVMIVPHCDNDTFLMTRQYRYLNQRVSLEFPGGGLLPGHTPEQQAQRELQEESGFAGDLAPLGAFNPCNGITDEMSYAFLATNLVPAPGDIRPDDSEEFERVRLSRKEIHAAIRSGELWDGMTLAAWQLYLVHETA
jgi:8-oxo-dGTP pyrophosphatase MutT (NUDIX family)